MNSNVANFLSNINCPCFSTVIMHSKADIAKFLLQSCNANASDNGNRTALDLATLTGQSETVDILEKHNKLIVT